MALCGDKYEKNNVKFWAPGKYNTAKLGLIQLVTALHKPSSILYLVLCTKKGLKLPVICYWIPDGNIKYSMQVI